MVGKFVTGQLERAAAMSFLGMLGKKATDEELAAGLLIVEKHFVPYILRGEDEPS